MYPNKVVLHNQVAPLNKAVSLNEVAPLNKVVSLNKGSRPTSTWCHHNKLVLSINNNLMEVLDLECHNNQEVLGPECHNNNTGVLNPG
jgi:hypothetical protein